MYAIGCEYPILIEDDALAEENWVESILLAIEQLKTREKPDNWFVIKLFVARSFYPQLKAREINSFDPRFNTVHILKSSLQTTLYKPRERILYLEIFTFKTARWSQKY